MNKIELFDNREIIDINNKQDLIDIFILKKTNVNGSFIYTTVEIKDKIININTDLEFSYTADTIVDTNFPSDINLTNVLIKGNNKIIKNLLVKKIGQQCKSLFNIIDKDCIINNLIFDNLSGFFANNNKGIIAKCVFKNMNRMYPITLNYSIENKYSFIIDGDNDGTISECLFSNIKFETNRDKVINDDIYKGISIVCDINNGIINTCSFENIKINSNKASLITFINKKTIINCTIEGENYITNNYNGIQNGIMLGGIVGILDGGTLQNIDIIGNIIINSNNCGLLCNSIINNGSISCITINYLNKQRLININAVDEYRNIIDNFKRIKNIVINNNFKYTPIYNIELNENKTVKIQFDKTCQFNNNSSLFNIIIVITIFVFLILSLLFILFRAHSSKYN